MQPIKTSQQGLKETTFAQMKAFISKGKCTKTKPTTKEMHTPQDLGTQLQESQKLTSKIPKPHTQEYRYFQTYPRLPIADGEISGSCHRGI